jgi:hypothetical protein
MKSENLINGLNLINKQNSELNTNLKLGLKHNKKDINIKNKELNEINKANKTYKNVSIKEIKEQKIID